MRFFTGRWARPRSAGAQGAPGQRSPTWGLDFGPSRAKPGSALPAGPFEIGVCPGSTGLTRQKPESAAGPRPRAAAPGCAAGRRAGAPRTAAEAAQVRRGGGARSSSCGDGAVLGGCRLRQSAPLVGMRRGGRFALPSVSVGGRFAIAGSVFKYKKGRCLRRGVTAGSGAPRHAVRLAPNKARSLHLPCCERKEGREGTRRGWFCPSAVRCYWNGGTAATAAFTEHQYLFTKRGRSVSFVAPLCLGVRERGPVPSSLLFLTP